jgi:DNA-binding NarL/FixJ family response regulator
MKVRVLIVDDQQLFRLGMRTLLSVQQGIEIVAEARDGQEALKLAALHQPDVVLMDLKMPVLDGVSAIRRLRAEQPSCRVLALTTFDDDDLIFEALRAGAAGYVLKDVSAERLVEAIRAVSRGEHFLQASIVTKVVAGISRMSDRAPRPSIDALGLSEREVEVLRLMAAGASNKQIAIALSIVEGTVKNHVTSILLKLKVQDRTQAALRARDLGIV